MWSLCTYNSNASDMLGIIYFLTYIYWYNTSKGVSATLQSDTFELQVDDILLSHSPCIRPALPLSHLRVNASCRIRSDSQTTGLSVADNWIDEDEWMWLHFTIGCSEHDGLLNSWKHSINVPQHLAQPGFEPNKSSPLPNRMTQLCFIYAAEFDLAFCCWQNLTSKDDPRTKRLIIYNGRRPIP